MVDVGYGVIVPENMQLEGFWLWLLSGMAAASVIHYLIAKIAGPLIFNRGWCGWACWTVALLDLLPWKRSAGRIDGKWEYLRYVHFALSLMIGLVLVNGFHYTTADTLGVVLMKQVTAMNRAVHGSIWTIPELWWFLGGNMVYFAVGVALAVRLKDNRAFCKYFCPIVPFFKVSSRPALIKIRADSSKCTGCGICERNCPMDISLTQYIRAGKRITSSECIICKTCTSVCPEGALELTYGWDVSIKDNLTRRKQGWRT